jgi:hypothetical protein
MDAGVWETTLLYSADNRPPAVTLQRFKPIQERYAYALTGMLDAVADGRGFNFGNFGSDATTHRLSPVALSLLAAQARRRVPGTVGRFEVVWVPNDPRVPF